jgi:hypothetical protein
MHIDALRLSPDFLVTPTGNRVHFHSADELRAGCASTPELIEIVGWCEQFLGRPSALLGRTGNVCPFVPEAMVRGSIKFAAVSLPAQEKSAAGVLEEIVCACREHFLLQEKSQGGMDIFHSIVLVISGITTEQAPATIDPVQRKLKPSFVHRGLMLGEFHPLSPTPGIRNRGFRPLRSPIPLLAIRHMVESDIDFLTASSDRPSLRVQSIKAYLKALGSFMSIATRIKAKEALKAAELEMERCCKAGI